MGAPDLREKARRVVCLLEEVYGVPAPRGAGDPLVQLVRTVLSQNTTDINAERAYQLLRARFPTWEAVLNASLHDVAEAIRVGGLARVKAGYIQGILRELRRQGRGFALSFAGDMPAEAVFAYLTGLPGVGPKTAACVLLFALRRPVLPVDTHVHRVSRRLGLIPMNSSAEKAHVTLQALLSEDQVYSFHVNMIAHGRRVCRARAPVCDRCRLWVECASRSAGEGERACRM
ncbi:MAG: endonuclease III [Armatimonadota bacterium]|nr:endonuclease III [Armatimonadota bacterium]